MLTNHGGVRGTHRLEDIAARQHGVFSRAQAIECGFSYSAIHARCYAGDWIVLDDAVYAFRSSPPTWERRLQAAILSRPAAFVAGRSAAYLHRFGGYTRGRPEILVPFDGNARSDMAKVIRSRHFDLIATTTRNSFTVTTIPETILTLSFRDPARTIERVVDEQLAARRLAIEEFDPILERLARARMRGLGALRKIVADRDREAYQPPTTELERLLYDLLDDPRVPRYDRQSPFPLPADRALVDAFVPDWGMIAEADGRRWHTRREDFEADRRRDNAAAASGFVVIRFTYWMLVNERDACLSTLLQTGEWRRPI